MSNSPPPASQPRPGDFLSIDLDLLDPNPFQPRTNIDPAEVEGLAASIAQSGQLQPIAVRPIAPGRYQIVAGERRTTAFRMLLAAAKTDAERRKYAMIRAHVVAAETDSAMAVAAYVENAQRLGLNPFDEAAALARIRELGGNLSSAEVAKVTGQPERRVRRLLRLAEAPEAVKEALTTGVLVEVASPEPGQPSRRERRRLELFAALEFTRLFEHLAKQKAATANERTATAIHHALSEAWPVKRVATYVDRMIAGRRPDPEAAQPGLASGDGGQATAVALSATTPEGFLVRVSRFPHATAEQLRVARQALEKLLDAIDDQLKTRPEAALEG